MSEWIISRINEKCRCRPQVWCQRSSCVHCACLLAARPQL